MKFSHYVVNKSTNYVIAGFNDANDAYMFTDWFKHGEYVVLAACEMPA